jgi:NAD+ kinase
MRPTPTFKTIGIISRPRRSNLAEVVPPLLAWLEEHGVRTVLDTETAGSLKDDGLGKTRHQVAEQADLLLVLGGDGTLLAAAREAAPRGVPILPVNMGSLGFLASFTVDELYPALEATLAGESTINERVLLLVERVNRGEILTKQRVLNDSVVHKGTLARMIELEVHSGDHFVCVYRADGLIVTTPTGSTAYSLSAGGPIVFPTVAGLCITPICPHMLTNRPVIVPDDMVIQIINRSDDDTTYLTIDGQVGELLKQNDTVVCRRSQWCVNLVTAPRMQFFDVLREKLKWGGR